MSMTYEERRAVYETAIEHYGPVNQAIVAVEEMAELTKELAKSFRPEGSTLEKLVDELADVTVMVEQLRLAFHINNAVQDRIDYKVRRLAQRIKEDQHA